MPFPIVRFWRLIPPHRYKYLWLIYINGIDITVHCQQSLIGLRSRKFSLGARDGYAEPAPIELNECVAPYYYICGGGLSYQENLHIAFRYKENHSFEVQTPREYWIIDHAERIEILESYIDKSDSNYSDDLFRRCRNWQFAHFVKRELEKEKQEGQGLLPNFLI